MSILKFSIPSDVKIQKDINKRSNEINFIGNGSFCQNLKETLYIRKLKFYKDSSVRKVIYKKEGASWRFRTMELINS
jgi:hypothetical protein